MHVLTYPVRVGLRTLSIVDYNQHLFIASRFESWHGQILILFT